MTTIFGSYNGTFIENFIDILWYAVRHSLMVLPFLFISFILIEYIHHRHNKKINDLITKNGKYAPVVGGALGIVPQCGFSSTVATLYANKIVSIGTLFAVLISTSDEAILILIAYPQYYKMLLLLIGLKLLIGISIGVVIDFFIVKKEPLEFEVKETCCCKKEHSIIKAALKHTISVFLFLVLFSFIVEYVVHLIGMDNLNTLLLNGSIFQPILATLIGLIPNCAASVLLTNLYVTQNLSFASLLAGLISNAGIGMLVLFKSNKNIKENIRILIFLFLIGSTVGIIKSLIMLLSYIIKKLKLNFFCIF